MADASDTSGFDDLFGAGRGSGRTQHDQQAAELNLEPDSLAVLKALRDTQGQGSDIAVLAGETGLDEKAVRDAADDLSRRNLAFIAGSAVTPSPDGLALMNDIASSW